MFVMENTVCRSVRCPNTLGMARVQLVMRPVLGASVREIQLAKMVALRAKRR